MLTNDEIQTHVPNIKNENRMSTVAVVESSITGDDVRNNYQNSDQSQARTRGHVSGMLNETTFTSNQQLSDDSCGPDELKI